MADNHSKEVRSYNMSRIRGKNTKPELLVRKYLFSKGYRYRLHYKTLPGKPDIVLPKYKTVIFIHGCFWHSHQNCKYAVIPKSNLDYWQSKLLKNIMKDTEALDQLSKLGWNIVVIWECELKIKVIDVTMKSLIDKISNLPN